MKNDVRKLAFVFAAAALLAGGTLAHVSSAEVLEVGAAKGDKISKVESIVSGTKYYVGANNASGVTKYFKDSTTAGNTAVATTDDATIVTLIGSGSSWSIQNEAGKYLKAGASKAAYTWETAEQVYAVTNDAKGAMQFKLGNNYFVYNASSPRFGGYPTAQTGIWLEEAEDSFSPDAPLSKIVIGGEPTNKDYWVDDVFDPAGLTVTAYFGDDLINGKDVTSSATWTFNPEKLSLGDTTVEATASVTVGDVTKPDSMIIEGLTVKESSPHTYSLLNDLNNLRVGSEVIITNTEHTVAVGTAEMKKYRPQTSVVEYFEESNLSVDYVKNSDIAVFAVDKGTVEGSYAFKILSLNKYISAASSSDNDLVLVDKVTDNASFKVSTSTEGGYDVKAQGDFTRNILRYNKGSKRFSCYGSNSTSMEPVSMYVYNPVLSEQGNTIVSKILNDLTCDMNGATAPNVETWNAIGAAFDLLPETDKAIMKNAKADVAGSDLEKAMAKYEYIVGKYTTYADFIGRGRDSAQANNVLSMMPSNDKTTILLSVMGLSGVALAGAFFLSRKRKMAR